MSGVTEDIRSFSCRFFFLGVLLSGGMLGPMGAAGSNCPRFFFSLFPLFFHVRRSGVRRTRPDSPSIFSCFFFHGRSGVSRMERTRPDSPSIFSLFFPRQEGWHPHGAHQARLALVFSLFFFPRQEEWRQPQGWPPHGPHQARLALVFSLFFSTPGGVASATGVASAWAAPGPTRLRVFFPFFPRQVEWDGAGSSGWKGPHRPAFFFTRLRHLAT